MTAPTVQGRVDKNISKMYNFYSREFNRKRHMELHVLFKHSQGREKYIVTIEMTYNVLFRSSIWL